ncbi:uncharacterized protein LOC104885328 [Beta vulgaris subsp. vulgaris]|uniref:uncharacterized protein LOC104885328 n=1 Tax=Beta vulgaris subsp. vulgaris TaxID=3555 RepID=UPI00203703C2|nr:uncharacterized protein LOC104885328 [Beta vulgaris subsp. vulgaris]
MVQWFTHGWYDPLGFAIWKRRHSPQIYNVGLGRHGLMSLLTDGMPPTYDGAADPVALEDWLREMEKLLMATNCPVAETTQFAAKLKERFYPDELRWQKQEEFLSLTQGNMNIQKYTDCFTELSKFAATVIPTEAERIKKYIKKMDLRVRTLVLCSGVTTFQGAYEMALSVHASIKEEETAKAASVRKPVPSFAPGSSFRPSFDPSKCRRCEKPSHPGKDCDGSIIVCFYYREVGHKIYECPKNPRATARPPAPPSHSAPPKNQIYSMTHSDADVHHDVITNTFLVNTVPAFVLFDSGATVSRRDVTVSLLGTNLPADLKEFFMTEFDVILGMDWLSKYRAQIHCRDKKVTLRSPCGKRISYSGVVLKRGVKIVSALKMQKLR